MDTSLVLQGNLVADPVQRQVASGARVTRFRMASSGRRFDQAINDWVSTDTVYMTVTCWRQLGDNVMQSLHKGDTVVVLGRLRFREYDDPNNGPRRQSYEVEAQAVGPDLSRYIATFSRPLRDLPPIEPVPVPAQDHPFGERPVEESAA